MLSVTYAVSFRGACPPNLHQGLCPWTPLGDFLPPNPLCPYLQILATPLFWADAGDESSHTMLALTTQRRAWPSLYIYSLNPVQPPPYNVPSVTQWKKNERRLSLGGKSPPSFACIRICKGRQDTRRHCRRHCNADKLLILDATATVSSAAVADDRVSESPIARFFSSTSSLISYGTLAAPRGVAN